MIAIGILWMTGVAQATGCDSEPRLVTDAFPDAAPFDPDSPCNPVTQTGCPTGRCTWMFEEQKTMCDVQAGTAALGDQCTIDGRGFDDCRAGLICIEHQCDEICGNYIIGDGNSCTYPTTCEDIAPIFGDENAVVTDVLTGIGACAL